MERTLTARDARELARVIARGGVAVFPTDTVYGLACDPENADAVARLNSLKGRAPDRPAAVMFFDPRLVLRAVPWVGPRSAAALGRLLPGAVTAVVANPDRIFPLACGPIPDRLGLRAPALPPEISALHTVRLPILQSSANPSGERDVREVRDIDPGILSGADLVLDAGILPGTPSTVIDLAGIEDGIWTVVRDGAVSRDVVDGILGDVVAHTVPTLG